MRQIPEEYVVKMEQDILDTEGIFVHTPSAFAKDNLFYVRLEALYTCGPRYEVRRSGLDSFLLFFIKEGELLFEYGGHSFVARKKDIVMARIFTVIFMQIAFILVMTALYPVARIINNAVAQSAENPNEYMIPGLGLDSYVLLVAIALIGYAIADIIFFPIYYKHGKSIVMSTLFTILGFVVYIGIFTIGLPFIPGLDILNNLHLGIQFAILGAAILISFGLHVVVYKVSSKRLEKVDF